VRGARRAVVIAVGLLGGLLVGWLALRPAAAVTVTVKNESAKPIASARLEHRLGLVLVENVAPGEARTIRFAAGGETSYALRVRFADGSVVGNRPQYAESGYSFVETVTEAGIKTDLHLPRY